MTREEATIMLVHTKEFLMGDKICWSKYDCHIEAIDMAIEALQADIVRCENCKHQDECEEVVLFEVNDDEVMGHRVHWCSYGRSK